MATKTSAGIIAYRRRTDNVIEIFIAHPGGPFWSKKDDGAWSIPKGEFEAEKEDARHTAIREFHEEIGMQIPDGKLIELGEIKQPSGKRIIAFAINIESDLKFVQSNTFEMEWPPRSGMIQEFPEVDRAGWFSLAAARTKLLKGQLGFVDLVRGVAGGVEGEITMPGDQETLF